MEKIFNIYLVYDDDRCETVAVRTHVIDGSDDKKTAFLKENLESDLVEAKSITLRSPFTRSEYNTRCRLGDEISLLEEIFKKIDASKTPLFISTPLKDGKPYYNYSTEHGEFDVNAASKEVEHSGHMEDWLDRYSTDGGFKLSELVHDDYFRAVKLLFNSKLYVSSMKLLLSCIDSIAYIEYGDEQRIFTKWLHAYADLSPLGITPEELWELRNGLLHMTNLNSRSVQHSKVRRISFSVTHPENTSQLNSNNEIYYFNFMDLVHAFSKAQAKWLETYNIDRDKFYNFVERYDETISDSRMAIKDMS